MENFIHEENIRRYRRLLQDEKDEEKRKIIGKLLAEEEANMGRPTSLGAGQSKG